MCRPFATVVLLNSLLAFANFVVAEINYKKLETPLAVAEFSLLDQYEHEFNHDRLTGIWTLMFIGFTSCPDVCPFTLENLEAVRAQLSMRMMPDQLPQVVFLAVDPARDKTQLRQYMSHFHSDFIGITGDRSQIDKLSASINGFYRIEKPKAGTSYYNVVHNSAVTLINPQGVVVATLNPPFAAQETANLLFRFIKGIESTDDALVKIESAWVPLAPPGVNIHAGYLTVSNRSRDELVITGFESTTYESISMHLTEMQDGMMSMQELGHLRVPANSTLTFEPMGKHLMMFGPRGVLENGEDFVVIMRTEEQGSYRFRMKVKTGHGQE